MRVGHSRSQRGYTLAELLVVVAIIGTLSLVTVPAFMTYQRSLKLKTSMRQLAADIRHSRQRAVTENHPTMISFRSGVGRRVYRDYDGAVQSDGTILYTQKGVDKVLDQTVYFLPLTDPCLFADDVTTPSSTNGFNDIVFQTNGTVSNWPADTCGAGKLYIRTEARVPKVMYTFEISRVGRVRAQ